MEEKKKIGRPTKYKESYNNEVYELCLLGCTNEELAEYFDVNVDTIYKWQLKHVAFSESMKLGKEKADSKVSKALYDRAIGYTVTKQQAIKVRQGESETVEVVELKVELPPDVGAIKFWLTNRQKHKWKDKQQDEEDAGQFKGTMVIQVGANGIVPLPSEENQIKDFTDDPEYNDQ